MPDSSQATANLIFVPFHKCVGTLATRLIENQIYFLHNLEIADVVFQDFLLFGCSWFPHGNPCKAIVDSLNVE